MTNTLLLYFAIKRAGLTQKEVYQRLNLSSMGFYRKATNLTEFKASEIAALYDLLKLSSYEEQQRIFFASDVHSNESSIPLPESDGADIQTRRKHNDNHGEN